MRVGKHRVVLSAKFKEQLAGGALNRFRCRPSSSPCRFKMRLTVAREGDTGHSRCCISRRIASAPCSPSGLFSLSCFRNINTHCSISAATRLTGAGVPSGRSFQSTRSSRCPLARLHQCSTVALVIPNDRATERIDSPRRTAKTNRRRSADERRLFLAHTQIPSKNKRSK